ncbi:O-antigen ligase family protein [Priestia filamentosa]|uniref:O-antigen ligase family protein n=1 Tax=Priestia filamentosa TaxID=1402861 RepID=UPI00398289FF
MKIVKFLIFFLFSSYIIFYLDNSGIGQKLKWMSIFLVFFALLFQFKRGIPKKIILQKFMIIWLFLFNVFGVITSLYFDILSSSLTTLIGLNLYFLIFYLASYSIKSTDNGIIKFNKIVIITSSLLIIFAFVVNLPLTLSQVHTYFFGRVRIYGIFQHPNYLGSVCFVGLLASFINLRLSKGYKKAYFLSLLFFFAFLILSDSRGGLYSFFIFLAVYYSITFVKKFKKLYVRLFLFIFFWLSLLMVFLLLKNFALSILENDELLNTFTSGRVDNWRYIIDNFITRNTSVYLFGHGFSSVQYLQEIKLNTDNGYIVWLYEAGLLNLIMVILLFLYLFFSILKNKTWNTFGVAVFLSYATYAFFENFLMNLGHIVPLYCWIMLFLGLFNEPKRKIVNTETTTVEITHVV